MESVTRMLVNQEDLGQVVQGWLTTVGQPPDAQIELYFLSGEVLIRPRATENRDLEEWLEGAMSRYDSLLRRLAEA